MNKNPKLNIKLSTKNTKYVIEKQVGFKGFHSWLEILENVKTCYNTLS